MIYTFKCSWCGDWIEFERSIHEGPPEFPGTHIDCGGFFERDWYADKPFIDTSMCKDHNDIPEQHRAQRNNAPTNPAAEEAKFQQAIQERRKLRRDAGDGSIQQTHMFPADLYHGKVKQTGDKNYWKDPKNLRKHKDCEI